MVMYHSNEIVPVRAVSPGLLVLGIIVKNHVLETEQKTGLLPYYHDISHDE